MSYTCAHGTFSRYTRYYYTQAPFQASKFRCPLGLSLASASPVCPCKIGNFSFDWHLWDLRQLPTEEFYLWTMSKQWKALPWPHAPQWCHSSHHHDALSVLVFIHKFQSFLDLFTDSSAGWASSPRLNTVTLKTVFQDMLKFIRRMSTLLNMCFCHAQNLEWSNGHCLQLLAKAFQRCWCWWSMMCFRRTAS